MQILSYILFALSLILFVFSYRNLKRAKVYYSAIKRENQKLFVLGLTAVGFGVIDLLKRKR